MPNIESIILLSNSKEISYTNDLVLINKKPIDLESGQKAEDIAKIEMRKHYRSILSTHFENLIILTGSGTSCKVGKSKKGKTMKELWESVVSKMSWDTMKNFCIKIKFKDCKEDYSDLEAMLSKATIAINFIEGSDLDSIRDIILKIEAIIKDDCTLELPDNSPQEVLLKKATARKLKSPRLKLFTLNYDLLFEQAASKFGYVVIDGFSFTTPQKFSGVNFDYDIVLRNNSRIANEENYAPKVFHLYKPHGSLNWEKTEDSVVKVSDPTKPLMIYPRSDKYEISYQEPFFEMMTRFQKELRNQNVLLIVIGFSFGDQHIKTMILESLNVNPSITVMIVSPDVHDEHKYVEFKSQIKSKSNVILINEYFSDFVENYPHSNIYDIANRDEDGKEDE